MDLFKPRGASQPRRPTDNKQDNGQIHNTPRYSQLGGLSSASATSPKSKIMGTSKPGDTKKVI